MKNSKNSKSFQINFPEKIQEALLNPEVIQEEIKIRKARKDFWEYRLLINPKLKIGWWQKEVARELQQFYNDLVAGLAPILIVQAPPQHGKSTQVIDFLSWVAGKDPSLMKIFASFSDRLGIRANLKLQRIYDSPIYGKIFPNTKISNSLNSGYTRNRDFLEYLSEVGYFRNTTVEGSVTGEALDVGVIDDPIKGRKEAKSETVRNSTWDWLTDDFMTRFSEIGAMLLVLTRWHVDDVAGRLIDSKPKNLKVLNYPAIATEDEKYRKKGDALFPEHKSLKFLNNKKALMTKASWSSLYDGNPIVVGGDLFKVEGFKIVKALPELEKEVRYWDKAGTKDGGAYTAGVKIGKLKGINQFIISDLVRGQWSALEREKRIKQTAQLDGIGCEVWVEQEPGSGGKESAESTVRNLAGFVAKKERVTGDKETRAEPYAAQVEAGNILILDAIWNKDFIGEHETFPNGTYKDQVDAAAGGFNKLAAPLNQVKVF